MIPLFRKLSALPLMLALLGSVSAANAQVTLSGSTLTIVTGNGDDKVQVKVEASGTRVFDIPGVNDNINYGFITALVIRTNGGLDKVQILVENRPAPTIDINTGAGISEVDMDLKHYGAGPTGVRVTTGNEDDKILIEADTNTSASQLNLTINAGSGKNETLINMESDLSPAALMGINLNINGGAQDDLVLIEMGNNLNQITASVSGSLGGGLDNFLLKTKTFQSGATNLNFNLDMGDGLDSFSVSTSESATTTFNGSVRTGLDGDKVEVTTSGILQGNPTIDTGDGNDEVKVFSLGALAATLRTLAGSGDDKVEIFSGIPGSASSAFSDGGPGFDIFAGIGTVVNFEIVSR